MPSRNFLAPPPAASGAARWGYANKMFRNDPRRRCRKGVFTGLRSPYSGTHSENFQLWAFRKFNFIFPENKMDTPVLLGNAQVCKGAGLLKRGLVPQVRTWRKERGFARKAPRRFAAIVRPDFCPLFRARNILPSPSPPPPRSLPIFQTPRRCGALFRGASIWKSAS